MAYRIVYEWEKEKQLLSNRPTFVKWVPGIAILLFLLSLRLIFPQTSELVREFFHPFTDSDTVLAFYELIAHVEQGVPVDEAILTFCGEILSNAK